MKSLLLSITIILMPQLAMADAYEFYYARCLHGAALLWETPNADGSAKDPNDPQLDIINPSKPLLHEACAFSAMQETRK